MIILNIKVAIFDMDGTLVDSLMFWDYLWKQFGNKYLNNPNFRPKDIDDKAVRTLTLRDAMKLIYQNYGIASSAEELFSDANLVCEDFYANRVKVKTGVIEYLDYLKQNNVKMCVASASAPDSIKFALSNYGILHYFDAIFSCVEIGKGKDEPDIYLEAIKYFNAEKQTTYVFEDSLLAIQTASKIGLKTVGIYDKYNFGHDEMQKIATEYIGKNEDLTKLIRGNL